MPHASINEMYDHYGIPPDIRQIEGVYQMGLALVASRGMVERLKGAKDVLEKCQFGTEMKCPLCGEVMIDEPPIHSNDCELKAVLDSLS
jgi:hypothetical protein